MDEDAIELDSLRWQATDACPLWLCRALSKLGLMRQVSEDELLSTYLNFDFTEQELNDAFEEACAQSENRGRDGRTKSL